MAPDGKTGESMTNMTAKSSESDRISAEAMEFIAGGVVSLNRRVSPQIVFVRAQGSKLYDADGKEYIDYHAAFAPHLLGHNDPTVNQAIRKALDEKWSLMGSGTTPWEVELARLVCRSVPSVDCVQITNTGSEATAHAIRLSRAWTGREDILVMLGGYNGWHNEVARAVMPALDVVGPRVSPGEYRFIPLSAGIPESTRRPVHVVNFNDLASVEYVMRRHPIACVLTEPVLQNIGVIPPQPGFLEGLRNLCSHYGALLVFDEVKTGFRCALGGYQSMAGVRPDLSVFGKAIANGYPLGVIGGRRDVMELFNATEESQRVLIAGTYNAHPLPTAAAITTIRRLMQDGFFERLDGLGARLQEGLEKQFQEQGVPGTVSRIGSAFCVYFCDHVPVDWHDVLANHDFVFDRRYREALISSGVYHFPAPCKQGSIGAAHTEEDIDRTLAVTRKVLRRL
jgi:glutamate-1-semialdehyde 2,1-aminomutase